MSDTPLPHRVNIRKAVTRCARYEGVLGGTEMPQHQQVLGADNPLYLEVSFGVDEDGRQVADVDMEATVALECQRCLKPLSRTLRSRSRLGLVHDDEQARHLPAEYEPWIALDEVDLWEVGAEELALALPVVDYHPVGECEAPVTGPPDEDDAGEGEAPASKDNPFSVLSALLENGADEEK